MAIKTDFGMMNNEEKIDFLFKRIERIESKLQRIQDISNDTKEVLRIEKARKIA